MDILAIVLAIAAVVSFICIIVSLESLSSQAIIMEAVVMFSAILAAVIIGLSIGKGPYVQATVGGKQVQQGLYNQNIYFGSPVAIFFVKAYKKRCLIPAYMTVIFADPSTAAPTPDEALRLITEN